jgi:Lanthionine synthetase C-like protein
LLYRPEDFEPLTDEPWDAARIRAGIDEIVADTDAAFRGPKLLWRADEGDRWRATSPLKTLYCGAAGVLWALDDLRRRGHAETRLDLEDIAVRTLERQRARPEYGTKAMSTMAVPEPRESSLLCGEAGILLVAYRIAPTGELADDLFTHLRANVENEAHELMWGSPGSMIAAKRMLDSTGDARWSSVWRECADALLARREGDGLWTQRMFGQILRFLGPVHGYVGNIQALLQLGDEMRRTELERDARAVLARSAVVEGDLANWPPLVGEPLVNSRGEIRVQWCHGAPGILAAAAEYLDEELLVAGAELTWRAGPHGDYRGWSLCHGTAGNGYAFLKAFARTGDERWLQRARRFGVHALAQARRQRAARGHGRYSLWTGDLGVAVYLADCFDVRTAFPVIEG